MLSDFAFYEHTPQEARALLQQAFEQTRMAMVVTDPRREDNPIIGCNRAFIELTGYPREEILGRNCRFLQGEDTDPGEVERIRRTVEGDALGYFELLNYRRDGTPFWNALYIGPITGEDGEILYHFGSQWDVTDRVRAVRALEEQLETSDVNVAEQVGELARMRMALDQANDAVVITEYEPLEEPGPRIVDVSQAFERLTGYARDEVIGRTPRMFQGPATDRAVLDEVRRSLEAGQKSTSQTINYRKDGTPYHLEWSIAPVRDRHGTPTHWLSLQRDVTERVEREERIALLNQELNHRHKNVFAVFGALLSAQPADGITVPEYQGILRSRLSALTVAHDAVFDDSSGEAPVSRIVEGVLAPFVVGDRLTTDPHETVVVPGPKATDLALLLHELSTNAVKYGAWSDGGGHVTIRWRRADDALWLDWHEAGGPPVAPPARQGFGSRMIGALATSGERPGAGLHFEADGVVCRASLRLD